MKIISKISIAIIVLALLFFEMQISLADMIPLTELSDTFERLKVSTESNQIVQFTSTSGIPNEYKIEIDYPADEFLGFGKDQLGEDDVEVYNVTQKHVYTDAADCDGDEEIYVEVGRDVVRMYFCAGDGGSANPGDVIRIYIGAFTDETEEDGNYKLTNPAVAGSKIITIVTGPSSMVGDIDSGSLAVSIVEDDQVTVTATVDPTLTLDIDTAVTNTEVPPPYEVDLKSIPLDDVATSDGSTINSIWIDFATNASGGGVVTVQDEGDGISPGLYNVSGDYLIPSVTDTLIGGTEGYGICAKDWSCISGSFGALFPYNGVNCSYDAHQVGALELTPANILWSDEDPVEGGRAEILVKAAVSHVTPAGAYIDTITFIATGTF